MPVLRSFTCFPQLPQDIRLRVWKQYALPEAPILYFVRHEWKLDLGMRGLPGLHKFRNIVRSIIQVNREARAAVLGHRKCYNFEMDNWASERILYLEGRRFRPDRAEHILYGIYDGYVLANWEKDAFHMSIGDLRVPDFDVSYYASVYGLIQNLVVHIGAYNIEDKGYLEFEKSWKLKPLFDATSSALSEIIPRLYYNLPCVRSIVLVIDHLDFETFYRQDVPFSVPSMKVYNHHCLRNMPYPPEHEFGLISIPALHGIGVGFGSDLEGFATAWKWHQDTLVPLVDDLLKETRSRLANLERGRQIDVRMALAPAVQGRRNNYGNGIRHYPVVYEGL
ncbi:hypothetical protein Hte_011666 [Hypoxylon texense]